MTVAAVVVPRDAAEALADTAGRAAVRRIVDSAWAGGAMPIIVVAAEADDAIRAALDGSPAVLVEPGADDLASYRAGMAAAQEAVKETSAVLLWPGRMTWVDPETVTSLLEAHGRTPGAVVRPTGRDGTAGWPLLFPGTASASPGADDVSILERLLAGRDGDVVRLDLGDPGSVIGLEVGLDALPDYEGPPGPVGGPPPEWGAAAADTPEPEVDPGSG